MSKRPRYGTQSTPATRPDVPIPGSEGYAFCESVTASSQSPWHLRELDAAGRKPGGGITTPSLCGRVRPVGQAEGVGGWDLDPKVQITPHHLSRNACSRCMKLFLERLSAE